MPIRVRVRSNETRAFLKRLRRAFKDNRHMVMLEGIAWKSFARLVAKTPKGFTGLTRQKWSVIKVAGRGYIITNTSKVMRFLEEGTRAHGPKTAKALYIPLNRAAALRGWHPGLVQGSDYILRGRVRGIRALKIVQAERVLIASELQTGMLKFIRDVG